MNAAQRNIIQSQLGLLVYDDICDLVAAKNGQL